MAALLPSGIALAQTGSPPSITSFSADPNPVAVPNTTTLTARVDRDPANTGYWTVIVDDDTGQVVRQCNTGTTCTASVTAGWPMNKDAKPLHYHAEVRSSNDVAGRSGQVTVDVRRKLFDVALAFSDRVVRSDGPWWTARATATPALYGTGYSLKIERADGSTVASCNPGAGCPGSSVKEGGTYRATVEDATGFSFGRSSSFTITADGPREESALDLDLVALGARFAGPAAICEALLTVPGTHFRGASVSDQYLACEAAVAAGLGTIAVLAAVAAEDHGTNSLWGLLDRSTAEPPEPEPQLVGPVGDIWQDEQEQLTRKLLAQNPDLTQREADAVGRQCLRLTARAPRNGDRDCGSMPIFASGADVAEATNHDLTALGTWPAWVSLNYDRSDKPGKGEWYKSRYPCDEPYDSQLYNCDEYPFFATLQGGPSPLGGRTPHLEVIGAGDNQLQGSLFYNRFLRESKCNLENQPGSPAFLGVPTPPASGIPTRGICNRPR